MNKTIKVLSMLIAAIIFIYVPISYVAATSTSGLQSEVEDINNQIKQKESEKSQVKDEKSKALSEVENLIYEISGYESNISSLSSEINSLKSKINEAQEQLAIEQRNYDKLDKEMQERIATVYEAGETGFLDLLLGSKDLVDFISSYYIASEIAKAEEVMQNEIEKKKNELSAAKEGLENSKTELEQKKSSLEKTKQALTETKSIKDQKVNELSDKEKEIQTEIEEYEQHKNQIEAELRRIAAEEEARRKAAMAASRSSANSGATTLITSNPSASGYIKPISGYSITTGLYYSSGRYHGAVDYSGSGIGGQPVVAVKDGTVVTSTAAINSRGNYYSYGEYIIINHHDGTMTLYAHGWPGSRKVYAGQSVKQGQVIMNVGTTGNSTGYHLHFEVRVNGSRVDPRPYLP